MTPVGVFFCWQGGAERDFVNSTNLSQSGKEGEQFSLLAFYRCRK